MESRWNERRKQNIPGWGNFWVEKQVKPADTNQRAELFLAHIIKKRLEGNALTLTEPPDADPHVRWCERRALAPPSYSISICNNSLISLMSTPLRLIMG